MSSAELQAAVKAAERAVPALLASAQDEQSLSDKLLPLLTKPWSAAATEMAKKAEITIHAVYPRSQIAEIEKAVTTTGGGSSTLLEGKLLQRFLVLIFGKAFEKNVDDFLKIYLEIAAPKRR